MCVVTKVDNKKNAKYKLLGEFSSFRIQSNVFQGTVDTAGNQTEPCHNEVPGRLKVYRHTKFNDGRKTMVAF